MKIGIFGGSFNPPHKMHKEIVSKLIKLKYVDKVIIVPTSNNYNKPCLLDGIDRINMLKGIFKNDKKVIISSFEVDGSLYTINTLNHFKKINKNDEIFFICGTDNLAELDTWNNYEKILKNYKLLVVSRDTNDFSKEVEKYSKYSKNIINANIKTKTISSTYIRKLIMKKHFVPELRDYLYVDTIKYLKEIDLSKWRI